MKKNTTTNRKHGRRGKRFAAITLSLALAAGLLTVWPMAAGAAEAPAADEAVVSSEGLPTSDAGQDAGDSVAAPDGEDTPAAAAGSFEEDAAGPSTDTGAAETPESLPEDAGDDDTSGMTPEEPTSTPEVPDDESVPANGAEDEEEPAGETSETAEDVAGVTDALPDTEDADELAMPNVRIEWISEDSVRLTWDAVPGAEYYQVSRTGENPGFDVFTTTDTFFESKAESSYCQFAVYSCAGSQKSAAANTRRPYPNPFTDGEQTTQESPPAVPNFHGAQDENGNITLTWDMPEGDIRGYTIHRLSQNGYYRAEEFEVNESQNSFTDTAVLQGGNTYTYRIYYYLLQGKCTYQSEYASTSVLYENDALIAPTWLSATNELQCGTIILSFDPAPGADGIRIYRTPMDEDAYECIADLPNTSIEYTDTDVEDDAGYYYKIGVYRGDECLVRETPEYGQTQIFNPIPKVTAQRQDDGSIHVTWEDVSEYDERVRSPGYYLFYSKRPFYEGRWAFRDRLDEIPYWVFVNNETECTFTPDNPDETFYIAMQSRGDGWFSQLSELIRIDPPEPETPAIPGTPIEPSIPSEPESPTIPGTPIGPNLPSEPENPTIPATPIRPSIPAEPDSPTIPASPIEPGTPAGPGRPGTTRPTGPVVPQTTTPITPEAQAVVPPPAAITAEPPVETPAVAPGEVQPGSDVLIDGKTPLGGFSFSGAWSLLNLMMSVLSLVMALLLFLLIFKSRKRKDKDDTDEGEAAPQATADDGRQIWHAAAQEEEEAEAEKPMRHRLMVLRVLAIITGLIPALLFLILENITLPMVWINTWTPLIGLFFLVNAAAVLIHLFIKKKDKEEKEGDEDMKDQYQPA